MAKMWAGRTSGEVSSIADDFNSSIHFDCKLYQQDITLTTPARTSICLWSRC